MADSAKIALADYRHIVVLTGAGVSVASGLPTYRGTGGLWNSVDVEGHAPATAIAADPARVCAFLAEIRRHVAGARANAAHVALAQAEQRLRPDQSLIVITQNVDGLHGLAGSTR